MVSESRLWAIVCLIFAVLSASQAYAQNDLMANYAVLRSTTALNAQKPVTAKDLIKKISFSDGRFSVMPIAPKREDSAPKLPKLGLTISVALGG